MSGLFWLCVQVWDLWAGFRSQVCWPIAPMCGGYLAEGPKAGIFPLLWHKPLICLFPGCPYSLLGLCFSWKLVLPGSASLGEGLGRRLTSSPRKSSLVSVGSLCRESLQKSQNSSFFFPECWGWGKCCWVVVRTGWGSACVRASWPFACAGLPKHLPSAAFPLWELQQPSPWAALCPGAELSPSVHSWTSL